MTIYLLELNKIIAMDIQLSLNKVGFDVIYIKDVSEFKQTKIQPGSVIIITFKMLLADSTKETVDALNTNVPVILISGQLTVEDFKKLNFSHNYHFLPKPFRNEELIELIKNLSNIKSTADE